MKKILISDVTLKEMSASPNFSFREKIKAAKTLDELGVDVIELPEIKNKRDDRVINGTVSGSVKNSVVKIPVGTTVQGIKEAYETIKFAAKPCLQVSLPVSTVRMEYEFHMKAPKMAEKIKTLCSEAAKLCERVEFNALDATRAEKEFLVEACNAAVESGAKCVTLCDDAGIMMPEEFAELVSLVKLSCSAKVFVCTSDKISMAVANALGAIVSGGADGVKTSLSGGEFMSVEKFADVLRERGDDLGISISVPFTAVHKSSEDVMEDVADAYDKTDALTEEFSLTSGSDLSEVCEAVKSLGYELSDEDYGNVYKEFQRVAAKKKTIGTKELEALIASSAMQVPSTYHLESYVTNNGNVITSTACVTLSRGNEQFSGVGTGDGPIDASFHTIEQIIGHYYELDDFQIQTVTRGRESMGSALVKLRAGGKLYSGNGISTDIVGASIRAYINALNKIVYTEGED